MKVTCEYCGSYVDADENMKCPLCGGALEGAVEAEQKRVEQQEEAEHQRELEETAQEAKEGHISEIINGVASVATAFAAGKGIAGAFSSTSSSSTSTDVPPAPPEQWENRPQPPEGHPLPPDQDHRTSSTREKEGVSKFFGTKSTAKDHDRPSGQDGLRDAAFRRDGHSDSGQSKASKAAFSQTSGGRPSGPGDGHPGGHPGGGPGGHPGGPGGHSHH